MVLCNLHCIYNTTGASWNCLKPPHVQVGYLCKQLREKHHHCNLLRWQSPQAQGAKVRTSISASQNRMQQKHATPSTTATTEDQHWHWWSVRCSNHCNLHKGRAAWKEFELCMCPYASCNDCYIMHSTSASADPQLVGGGGAWSCILLLHPALTCADAGLTFAPCACGGFHRSNLQWWCFSLSRWYTTLAHVVVAPIATCTGGVFPSPDYCRHKIMFRKLALCGVFGGGGGRCVCMWRWWL